MHGLKCKNKIVVFVLQNSFCRMFFYILIQNHALEMLKIKR